MAGTWIAERIGQVLDLSGALIRSALPEGVSQKDAQLRHAQLKVELYEAMAAERPALLRSSCSWSRLASA